jgi:hypothetical protein
VARAVRPDGDVSERVDADLELICHSAVKSIAMHAAAGGLKGLIVVWLNRSIYKYR